MGTKNKVWRDIDDVVKASYVPDKYKGFDDIMKEIPNHSKSNTKVIYRRKEFVILKARDGFIVVNTKSKYDFKHTHTNNYAYAKSIIDLCIRKKMPDKPTKRLVESLQRVSLDKVYVSKLDRIKEG